MTHIYQTNGRFIGHKTDVPQPTTNGKTRLFGGKSAPCPMKDTVTGITFRSKAEVGRKMAKLVDGNPKDNFVWYKILAKYPARFVPVSK